MEQYTFIGHIGEGAHGIVLKAKHKTTSQVVALKKVPFSNIEEGISAACLREMKALQVADHENVVKMLDVHPYDAGIALVFEYMPTDLSVLLRCTEGLMPEPQVKSYMEMLLKGVAHCHSLGIMHRDLKPANLLLSSSGILKIADFGQADLIEKVKPYYTHEVATRWYRAPELLYGAHSYDEGVDLWAVGCIFGELLNKCPLFRGENDIEQLCIVLQALGTPSEETWPEMKELPDFNKISFPTYDGIPWEKLIPQASDEARQLLSRFLIYSSKKRISASQALLDDYFFTSLQSHCMCHLSLPNCAEHASQLNICPRSFSITPT